MRRPKAQKSVRQPAMVTERRWGPVASATKVRTGRASASTSSARTSAASAAKARRSRSSQEGPQPATTL
ncbi:MAG TPA: hypothetical protein VF710_09120 [Longimicrobium sp.]